jgi:hypothetical protein
VRIVIDVGEATRLYQAQLEAGRLARSQDRDPEFLEEVDGLVETAAAYMFDAYMSKGGGDGAV